MCYSIPGQIMEIVDPVHRIARVDISGQSRMVNLGVLPEDESMVGDWVLVQSGLAVERVSPDEVQNILALIEEINQFYTEEDEI